MTTKRVLLKSNGERENTANEDLAFSSMFLTLLWQIL